MIFAILASVFTFTATATGVEKGTALEFMFVGKDSDRDYEAMFLLEESIPEFIRGIEQAGLVPGRPSDVSRCQMWPVGCSVEFSPPIDDFVEIEMPAGIRMGASIYTGGTKLANGLTEASTNMPASVLSFYTLPQSLFLLDGIYEQGDVYGAFKAAKTLKKGCKYRFSVTWDSSNTPTDVKFTVKSGEGQSVMRQLRELSANRDIVAEISFDRSLSVNESVKLANALSVIDSAKVKINGRGNGLFYRAFMPMVKWLDRKERMVQPFELTLGNPDSLVYIAEDWSVPGDDPKLTPIEIPFERARKFSKTDTCFIFTKGEVRLGRIYDAIEKLNNSAIRTWYVFAQNNPSIHNAP